MCRFDWITDHVEREVIRQIPSYTDDPQFYGGGVDLQRAGFRNRV